VANFVEFALFYSHCGVALPVNQQFFIVFRFQLHCLLFSAVPPCLSCRAFSLPSDFGKLLIFQAVVIPKFFLLFVAFLCMANFNNSDTFVLCCYNCWQEPLLIAILSVFPNVVICRSCKN
jgi:hypothetical protein